MPDIISNIESGAEAFVAKVDVPALIAAAQSFVNAWPSIQGDIANITATLPTYVAAIEKALSGQTPTDADWSAVDAQLDAGDADIAAAGAAAQAQVDAESAAQASPPAAGSNPASSGT